MEAGNGEARLSPRAAVSAAPDRCAPYRRGTMLCNRRRAEHHANAITDLKKHYGHKRLQQGPTEPLRSAHGGRDHPQR